MLADATFARDLELYGPEGRLPKPPALGQARRYCRRLARRHYENFTVASWLLPRKLRQHFCNVYAYCRWADDLADEAGDPSGAWRCLAWWERQLRRLLPRARPASGVRRPGRDRSGSSRSPRPAGRSAGGLPAGPAGPPLRGPRANCWTTAATRPTRWGGWCCTWAVPHARAVPAGRLRLHRSATGQLLPGRGPGLAIAAGSTCRGPTASGSATTRRCSPAASANERLSAADGRRGRPGRRVPAPRTAAGAD